MALSAVDFGSFFYFFGNIRGPYCRDLVEDLIKCGEISPHFILYLIILER